MLGSPRTAVLAALLAVTAGGLVACSSTPKPTAHTSPSTTASATPTPAPPVVATCPLTGLPPAKGQQVRRVALAVKIDNIDLARPQSGLDHADLVVEETVEGGLTRLFAVFQCSAAPKVGPVRSARTSDGDLLRLFHGAVFGYSGANPRAIAPVAATSGAALVSYDASPQVYYRDGSRPAPHNVYSSTERILKAGLARKKGLRAPRPVFTYGNPADGLGKRVHAAAMTWPSASASWTWGGHAWLRTQNGSPDVLADGARVKAANVVIMSIAIKSTGLHDVLGNPSPDDVVTGGGHVWVLRDGHLIKGTWRRATAAKPMVLRDKKGKVIALHAGPTWIELLPRPRVPHLS